MPLSGASKSIAERVDLGFHRRGDRFRRRRWRYSLAALAAALLLPAWAAVDRRQRLYQSGPLSQSHQIIANDCQRCHIANWQPAKRLARLDDRLSSTPDEGCIVCHKGPPHHVLQPPARTHCADCHREHRGREALSRVADQDCTQCHASLETTRGPSTNFVRSIDDFANHPQFAVLRPVGDGSPTAASHVSQVAEQIGGKWRDRARLRFNHKKHAGNEKLLRLDGSRQALRCQHCHQFDAASGYMRPISHERHCSECHGNQLHFDERRFATAKVMHGPVARVRGELLDRYVRLARNRPELAQDEPSVDSSREAPGTPAKLGEQGWHWVNGRLDAALDQLLNRKQLGCRYCHTDVRPEAADGESWTVADPRIPARWLRHSVFRHDRHQFLACTECHGQTLTSSDTADILLPGIENCRQCHASRDKRGSARGDCVECHVYHHREGHESGN